MRLEEIKNQINRLALSDKILLVEDIWDSIAADNCDIPIAEWQKKELNRRYQEYKDGKLELHDWKTVHKELREKYK